MREGNDANNRHGNGEQAENEGQKPATACWIHDANLYADVDSKAKVAVEEGGKKTTGHKKEVKPSKPSASHAHMPQPRDDIPLGRQNNAEHRLASRYGI